MSRAVTATDRDEEFCRGVREFRRENGLTQQELANEMGISLRTVKYIEHGGFAVWART